MPTIATPDSLQNHQTATIYIVKDGRNARRLFLQKDGLLFSHVMNPPPSQAEIEAVQASLNRERAALFAADPALAEYFPAITVHA